jgi:hypothetical protein
VKGTISRGKFCIIEKLISERMVSKETIKTTFIGWWKLKKTFTFKILGENLFLIEFVDASNKARRVVLGFFRVTYS